MLLLGYISTVVTSKRIWSLVSCVYSDIDTNSFKQWWFLTVATFFRYFVFYMKRSREFVYISKLVLFFQNFVMDEEPIVRSETDIRKSVYGKSVTEVHLGNYEHSITRPTVASARKSVLWSRERKVYETASRRRLEEFKSNSYFRYEYPEIPRHWPGTWAVMTVSELKSSVGRLSRPSTARPATAPVRTLLERFPTQPGIPRTVKTPSLSIA